MRHQSTVLIMVSAASLTCASWGLLEDLLWPVSSRDSTWAQMLITEAQAKTHKGPR